MKSPSTLHCLVRVAERGPRKKAPADALQNSVDVAQLWPKANFESSSGEPRSRSLRSSSESTKIEPISASAELSADVEKSRRHMADRFCNALIRGWPMLRRTQSISGNSGPKPINCGLVSTDHWPNSNKPRATSPNFDPQPTKLGPSSTARCRPNLSRIAPSSTAMGGGTRFVLERSLSKADSENQNHMIINSEK